MTTEIPPLKRSGNPFFRRKTVWRLTWIGKFAIAILLLVLAFLGRHTIFNLAVSFITAKDTARHSDAILMEGWKYPHGSIIRAALKLQKDGMGKDLFFVEYPYSKAKTGTDLEFPRYYHEMLNLYFKGEGVEPDRVGRIAIELKDPVTWNTAFCVMDELAAKKYASMIIVTPWYHSRRSCDVYTVAGKRKGIEVTCKPVDSGGVSRENWWRSHMGMGVVFGEVIKRIYYIMRIS